VCRCGQCDKYLNDTEGWNGVVKVNVQSRRRFGLARGHGAGSCIDSEITRRLALDQAIVSIDVAVGHVGGVLLATRNDFSTPIDWHLESNGRGRTQLRLETPLLCPPSARIEATSLIWMDISFHGLRNSRLCSNTTPNANLTACVLETTSRAR
jgi:hypothetical protein